MSDLATRFADAKTAVTEKLTKRPDTNTLLKLYSLYKQGSQGDVEGDRPGLMDFVNRAKYDAWAELQGTTKDDAMQQYIDLVEELVAKEG